MTAIQAQPRWMSEWPVKHSSSTLHWVPTGVDPSGWRERPIGSWVPACDDTLPVGALWDADEEREALKTRRRCAECVEAALRVLSVSGARQT